MITPSRRTIIKGSLALGAAAVMPAALRAATGNSPALFIYDVRFAASRDLANEWQARGVTILDPRDHDLGLAWREHIPRLLSANGRIEGATLWSDRFVCETFARDYGLQPEGDTIALTGVAGGSLRHWSLA